MKSTAYVQKFRARKREGRLLLPRIEIDNTIADDLFDAHLIKECDLEDPQAIAQAIVKLLQLLRKNISNLEFE